MDNQKKYAGNHGRKPKPDKMRHRYVFRLDDGDNARFLALFDESGKATKAEFIVSALFGREIKVIKLDKGTQDFYMRLTTFHSQFRAIGTNYNQCVRALKSNFSEKKALAFLYKLERHTLELVELSKRISALVEAQGGEAYNGAKMLLYQGIIAFELWTGCQVEPWLADKVYERMQKAKKTEDGK